MIHYLIPCLALQDFHIRLRFPMLALKRILIIYTRYYSKFDDNLFIFLMIIKYDSREIDILIQNFSNKIEI